jgi:hypothetical protein
MNCVCCGSPIPKDQGSNTCSMCYGDAAHGKDGYYEREMREHDYPQCPADASMYCETGLVPIAEASKSSERSDNVESVEREKCGCLPLMHDESCIRDAIKNAPSKPGPFEMVRILKSDLARAQEKLAEKDASLESCDRSLDQTRDVCRRLEKKLAAAEYLIGKLDHALKNIPAPRRLEIEGCGKDIEAVRDAQRTWNGYVQNIYFGSDLKNHVAHSLDEISKWRKE